jgi:hypothetical protein
MTIILQATSATHVRWALGPKAILDELQSNNILIWRQHSCHGKVLRHGSPKRGPDMILFSSARDNHVMAEAQGHAGYQFSRLSDEASHSSGLVPYTQDQEEYLHAYVRRFLRLTAQAPTVPNEIVIEAMIKGLRPGPTAQYFARKPPRLWRSCFRKWTSTFRLIMTSDREGRKLTDFLR